MLTFRCDCGKQLQAREEYAGQVTACPTCGRELVIPGAGAVRAEPPPAAALPVERPPRRRLRPDEYEQEDRRYGPPAGTSGKATAAFVMGLLSFCVPVLLSLLAIVFGILGLADINRSRARLGGRGLAITGLVLGCLTLLLSPLVLLLGLIPAISNVRTAAARVEDQNNLKQIGMAFHNYADVYKEMPPAAVYGPDRRPLYSWRVLLLPYLEHDQLYKAYHFNEPWDSPHNMQYVQQMPKVYANPLDPDEAKRGLTHYQVFVAESQQGPTPPFVNDPQMLQPFNLVGPFNLMSGQRPRIPASFPDGTSNTILVAEGAEAVPWTKPDDLSYSPRGPLPRLATYFGGHCNVCMADGMVQPIRPDRISEQTMRNVITANDGNVIGPDWP